MSSPSDYQAILDLTKRMRDAANAQDWDELIRIESERRSMLAAIANRRGDMLPTQRERATIAEIASIDKEVIEQVEAWRNDVGTLLGIGREQSA